MSKVEFFRADGQLALEGKVNEFIKNKEVLSISYSTNSVGYSVYHYCCVLYKG